MVGVLIISHGVLADALISEVRFLIGNLSRVQGVCVQPIEDQQRISDRIQEKMAEVDEGDGIMILTDILGGTPTNLSLPFLKDERVQVLTGVNLPMLLSLSSCRSGRTLEEVCRLVKKSGRRSIVRLSKNLV